MRGLMLAVLACGFAASVARAESIPTLKPEACASRVHFHRAPIYPREVILQTSGDPVSQVAMIVCFAARRPAIGNLYVRGAALAGAGDVVGANGNRADICEGAQPPVVGCHGSFVGDSRRTRGGGFPRRGLIGETSFAFQIDLPAGRKLARKALVSFQWAPCLRKQPDGPCQLGAQRTDTFLIPARIVAARPIRQ